MTPEYALDMARQAIQVATMTGVPMLPASLVVGLLVAVFQATMQLNERTLPSIPKPLAATATMVLTSPWIVAVIVDYTHGVLANIPNYVN